MNTSVGAIGYQPPVENTLPRDPNFSATLQDTEQAAPPPAETQTEAQNFGWWLGNNRGQHNDYRYDYRWRDYNHHNWRDIFKWDFRFVLPPFIFTAGNYYNYYYPYGYRHGGNHGRYGPIPIHYS